MYFFIGNGRHAIAETVKSFWQTTFSFDLLLKLEEVNIEFIFTLLINWLQLKQAEWDFVLVAG